MKTSTPGPLQTCETDDTLPTHHLLKSKPFIVNTGRRYLIWQSASIALARDRVASAFLRDVGAAELKWIDV